MLETRMATIMTCRAAVQQRLDAPLAGDHLVGSVYQPIEVVQFGESRYRGHSVALGLDLCWEDG